MVLIGRWAKTLASGETGTVETMIAAVNACLQYTNWYGWRLPTVPRWWMLMCFPLLVRLRHPA
jgi:hypothetical protein